MSLTTTQHIIGKYQVMAKLAESPTGKVYKGFDPSTNETVAIKIATTAVVRDKVMLQRFEHEFRSMSILRHPNIVRGLDFGWEGPKPFMVLEYVEGEDLWSRIERLGRIPEAEAIELITQVAEGLHEAHKHGILHRNIKPDNILLTNDGQAKVADMGLSKDLEEDADLTRPYHGLGTPNFIAPEQFGDAKNATIRCDIYSLGTTLYMALTGQVPFEAASLTAIMKLKLANEMTSPRKLVPSLSESVEWAVRRAIQADPNRRFATCPDFIAALTTDPTGPAVETDGKRRLTSRRTGNESSRSGKDRRAALRFDCSLPTACVINNSLHHEEAECQTSWDAQVCSLSVTGIGLLLPRRFEPGSVLTVVLSSRGGNLKETRQMRVARVARADGNGWFLAGPLTIKLSKEELRKLL